MPTGTCEQQGDIEILPVTSQKYHDYHAVEGFDVSFSYDCIGTVVSDWWIVDDYPISYHDSPYPYNYKKKPISSENCINTLTLVLYNIRLNYTNKYIVYLSKDKHFNKNGASATACLSEYMHVHIIAYYAVNVW